MTDIWRTKSPKIVQYKKSEKNSFHANSDGFDPTGPTGYIVVVYSAAGMKQLCAYLLYYVSNLTEFRR